MVGKRSYVSDPAVIEVEHGEGVALPSSKRRVVQVASNTTAMALLALRTEVLTTLSEVTFPSNEPLLRLQPHRQAIVVEDSSSAIAITDDEDDNTKNMVADTMFYVAHSGLSLVQPAPRNPIFSIAGTRRWEAPNHRKLPHGRPLPAAPMLPFGRPLPAAPVFPSSLLSRGGIPSIDFVPFGQSYLLGTSECMSNTTK
jgi:hypothetical protein